MHFNKLIKQVDDLEGVSDMKEEVEKKRETWKFNWVWLRLQYNLLSMQVKLLLTPNMSVTLMGVSDYDCQCFNMESLFSTTIMRSVVILFAIKTKTVCVIAVMNF